MKLLLICCCVSLMLYLNSITTIECVSRQELLENALTVISDKHGTPDDKIELKSLIRKDHQTEYWEAKRYGYSLIMIRAAEGSLQEGNAFKDEPALFRTFQINDELMEIVPMVIYYDAANIAVTELHVFTLFCKDQSKNTFPNLRRIGAKMVKIFKILYKHGYTGNGLITDLGYLVHYLNGTPEVRLSGLSHVKLSSTYSDEGFREHQNDLSSVAMVLEGSARHIRKKALGFIPYKPKTERNAFLRDLFRFVAVVSSLSGITEDIYDTLGNILDPVTNS